MGAAPALLSATVSLLCLPLGLKFITGFIWHAVWGSNSLFWESWATSPYPPTPSGVGEWPSRNLGDLVVPTRPRAHDGWCSRLQEMATQALQARVAFHGCDQQANCVACHAASKPCACFPFSLCWETYPPFREEETADAHRYFIVIM